MSIVEDVRGVLQDFLTPEIRELKVRIEAVEHKVDDLKASMQEQFGQVQDQFQRVQDQFHEAERRAEKRHDEMSFIISQGLEYRNLA